MAGETGRAETPLQVIGFLSGLALMCWGIWSCAGCARNADPQQPPAAQKSKFDLDPSPKTETPNDLEASGPLLDARERVNRQPGTEWESDFEKMEKSLRNYSCSPSVGADLLRRLEEVKSEFCPTEFDQLKQMVKEAVRRGTA